LIFLRVVLAYLSENIAGGKRLSDKKIQHLLCENNQKKL